MADHVDAVIKVKRGLESQRKSAIFADGELAYSTDVKRLFVGDGGHGGNPTSSKTFIGLTTPTYAISGDFFVDTTTSINKLYVLTASESFSIASYALISDNTPAWEVYSLVRANSAFWGAAGGETGALAYTTLITYSANWQSTYSTVKANSGTWNAGSTVNAIVKANSANWDSTYSTMKSNSANWDSTYSTVKANSASWGQLGGLASKTYETALTASGNFIEVVISGTTYAIRLWNTV